MKLTLLALVLASQTVLAQGLPMEKPTKTQWGSQCGLSDGFDSDSMEEVGPAIEIQPGVTLTELETQQILDSARGYAGEAGDGGPATIEDAIAYLNDASEGGEVYLQTNVANGVEYDVMLFYPGGNPVGVIFKKGTTTQVAHIEDSDIVCVK